MATLTVPATIDSYMSELQGSTNFGASSYAVHDILYAGGTKLQWRRGIANFDVSDLAGAAVNAAKLVREISYLVNGGQEAILSRCTRPADWVEYEVTWGQFRLSSPWTNGGGDFDDAGPPASLTYVEPLGSGEHEIQGLAPFVTDALENREGIVSLITRLAHEAPGVSTQYAWDSREVGSRGWRLVVEYTPYASPSPGRRSARRSRLAAGRAAARPIRPATPAAVSEPARPRAPRPAPNGLFTKGMRS